MVSENLQTYGQLSPQEADIIDEKGSMEEQLLKSALGRKRAACSEDFFHIYAGGGAHVHSTLSYPYCVLFSENLASSVLYKEIFSREIPLTAPTGPLHNPLLGGAEKSSLYAKQSCAAKPSLLGTNSSKQALLLLLLDCSLRIASGMVRIFF